MKAYKLKDLQEIQRLIVVAKRMVLDDVERLQIEDSGTCVLDNGIEIEFVPPRCRKPVRKIIVDGPFQGNVSNFKALQGALEFLKNNGIDCRYQDGVLD